jgi:hypothetical protein
VQPISNVWNVLKCLQAYYTACRQSASSLVAIKPILLQQHAAYAQTSSLHLCFPIWPGTYPCKKINTQVWYDTLNVPRRINRYMIWYTRIQIANNTYPHHIDTDTQVYIQDTFDIDSTHTCLASRFRYLTLQCAAGRHSEVLVLASVKMLHCRRIQYITVHNTIYIASPKRVYWQPHHPRPKSLKTWTYKKTVGFLLSSHHGISHDKWIYYDYDIFCCIWSLILRQHQPKASWPGRNRCYRCPGDSNTNLGDSNALVTLVTLTIWGFHGIPVKTEEMTMGNTMWIPYDWRE